MISILANILNVVFDIVIAVFVFLIWKRDRASYLAAKAKYDEIRKNGTPLP